MYILTGDLKGKKIKTVRGKSTRPTSSRVKKSIFDTLGDIDENVHVLDIFAGSGNLGIEALSRGVRHTTFIERNKNSIKMLEYNISNLGFKDKTRVLGMDYVKSLKILKKNANKFGLIFIDPPYSLFNQDDIVRLIEECDEILDADGTIVIEHEKKIMINFSNLNVRTKNYGGTSVSFLRRTD